MATRRWFYFIPVKGEPRKLVHRIEQGTLDTLEGKKFLYAGWEELHKMLPRLLSGSEDHRDAVFAGQQYSLHRAGGCRND